ncbi:MAG: mycothiol-dependent nitroreductase Rv2466c family protein [Leucobacter sp.]
MSAESPNVEFYFDPICPWCWMTSRWAAEVADVRGFEVDWKPVSLKIINEGNGEPKDYHIAGHRLGRVAQAALIAVGPEAVDKLYTEFGTRIHPDGRSDFDAIISEALAALDIDEATVSALTAAADTEESDEQLRANTVHALDIAGPDVGVPIISIDGNAFFGPVMTPAPTGDDALRLWDGINAAASVPGFYELKRGRTEGPQF